MKRGREEIGAGAGVDPAMNDGGRKYNKSGPGKPSWLEPVEEGQKRARRPPPRFESPTTAQEEMIIRQAIENSKIETKLSTDSVASIPEVPTYWCVLGLGLCGRSWM